jgi:hypothetical protein
VHVAEHVHRRGDRAVEPDAAGRGHARDRDARRLRPVIDACDQRRLEQLALRRVGSSPRVISHAICAKLARPIRSSIA